MDACCLGGSLLVDVLEAEEEHIDWIETQLAMMDRLGDPLYLQSKIGDTAQ